MIDFFHDIYKPNQKDPSAPSPSVSLQLKCHSNPTQLLMDGVQFHIRMWRAEEDYRFGFYKEMSAKSQNASFFVLCRK